MEKEYEITAVSEKTKEWDSKYGPMVTYFVKFVGETEAVQINRKQESAAPKVGDKLNGKLEDTEYGPKFKQSFSRGGFGGSKESEMLTVLKEIREDIRSLLKKDSSEPEDLDLPEGF